MKRRLIASVSILTFLTVWCGSAWAKSKKDNPEDIGHRKVSGFSLISLQKEIAIGARYSAQIDRTARLLKDPVVTEYINRVEQNIARNSDAKVPITVHVIDDPRINAMTLPGGYIYVNTGLILAATKEDELAGVLAHETGHVAERSFASLATKQMIAQWASLPLMFIPMTLPVYYAVSEGYMNGIPMVFLKFSRNQEAGADFLGIQYMWKAGYDPNGMLEMFAKIMRQARREPGSVPSVFMDHPPNGDRIIAAEKEIKDLLPKRHEYLVTTSEFSRVRQRLEADVSQLRISEKSQNKPTLKPRRQKPNDHPPVLKPGTGN